MSSSGPAASSIVTRSRFWWYCAIRTVECPRSLRAFASERSAASSAARRVASPARITSNTSCAASMEPPSYLARGGLQLDERDLGRRAEPQRRPPVPRPAAHVQPHRFEAVQPGDERLKQAYQQTEGKVLP